MGGVFISGLSIRLKELRKKNNIMQIDIATSINISLRSYQRYENGERNPDSEIIIKLAEYFNVSIDYLVGRSDDPTYHK